MRINARLDDAGRQKLEYLQRTTGWKISEVVRRAIDAYYLRFKESHAGSAEILTRSGFIGCSEGPKGLSETYKGDLRRELAGKHDHR